MKQFSKEESMEQAIITNEELKKVVNAYLVSEDDSAPMVEDVSILEVTPVEDGQLIKFNCDGVITTYCLVFGDPSKRRDTDLVYFMYDWQSGVDVNKENISDVDWILANEHVDIAGLLEETKKSEAVKLTYVDTIRVPQWMWVADQTGDTSDLEDDEIEMLKEFQQEYKDKHLDDKGEDPYFSSRNDFDSLGGNVYDIDVYEMDTKSEKVSKMKESKQTKEFPYKFKFNFYSTRTIGYVEDAIKELGIGDVQDIPEDGLFVYVKEPTDILKVVDKAIAIGNASGSDLTSVDMYRTVGSANKYGILAYGDREVVEDAGTEYGVSWTYFDLAQDDSDNYIQAIGELDDIVDFFVAIR